MKVRMRNLSKRDMEKILQANGYKYVGCKGDHFKYKRNNTTIVITKKMNQMIAKRLIKDHHLIVR